MKIYRATLILRMTESLEYGAFFTFEQMEEDFEEQEDRYFYFKDWVSTTVPKEPKVETIGFGSYKVEQGFQEVEVALEELEKQYKELMRVRIKQDRARILEDIDSKLMALGSEV